MDEPDAALNLPDNCAMSALSTTEYSEKIHYEYAVQPYKLTPLPYSPDKRQNGDLRSSVLTERASIEYWQLATIES